MIPGKKFHAYGNDFLVVEAKHLSEDEISPFSETACRAHFGIGADGCVVLDKLSECEFQLRIFNRDGSEAGMSGNGARCAAAYVHQVCLSESDDVRFRTISGEKRYHLLEMRFPNWKFISAMGVPCFEPHRIPVELSEGLRNKHDYTLSVAGEEVTVTPLWVGNPQCVKFVTSLPQPDEFETTGKALEGHPFFPERTNVSFVEILDRHKIRIKIWERGVGPTHSSGTGSSGAGVAAIVAGKACSPVEVSTETGMQIVAWKPSEEVMLTGEATFVADFNFHWEKRGLRKS